MLRQSFPFPHCCFDLTNRISIRANRFEIKTSTRRVTAKMKSIAWLMYIRYGGVHATSR